MTKLSLLVDKDGSTQEFDLEPVTKIGRGPDNDIVLEDPLRKSLAHARANHQQRP